MSINNLGQINKFLLSDNQPITKKQTNNVNLDISASLTADTFSPAVKVKNDKSSVFNRPENLSVKPVFIKNVGGNFSLDNKPFKFIGTNMYSLANEKPEVTDKMIQDAAKEGFTTIRFWADKASSEKLTQMCDTAKKYNIKLIPVLANHYTIGENNNDSWYKEGYKKTYLPHLKELVETTKNRPEIMMWELINEPSTEKFESVYNFSKGVSSVIDNIDKNHMITIGTIGGVIDKFGNETSRLSISNFKKLYSLPNLDAVSVHDYSYDARALERLDLNARNNKNPDAAKKFNTLDKYFSYIPNKIDKFLLDKFDTMIYNPLSLRGIWNSFNEMDIKVAKDLNKPIFWGEVGFKKSHNDDRRKMIDMDISKRMAQGVQGYMLWSFEAQGHSIDGHDYGFNSQDNLSPVIKKWNNSFNNQKQIDK